MRTATERPRSPPHSLLCCPFTNTDHHRIATDTLSQQSCHGRLSRVLANISGHPPDHPRRSCTDGRRGVNLRKAGHMDSNGSEDTAQHQGGVASCYAVDANEVRCLTTNPIWQRRCARSAIDHSLSGRNGRRSGSRSSIARKRAERSESPHSDSRKLIGDVPVKSPSITG
jgi:hypothetical protein